MEDILLQGLNFTLLKKCVSFFFARDDNSLATKIQTIYTFHVYLIAVLCVDSTNACASVIDTNEVRSTLCTTTSYR
jgi:hypothetical protein